MVSTYGMASFAFLPYDNHLQTNHRFVGRRPDISPLYNLAIFFGSQIVHIVIHGFKGSRPNPLFSPVRTVTLHIFLTVNPILV